VENTNLPRAERPQPKSRNRKGAKAQRKRKDIKGVSLRFLCAFAPLRFLRLESENYPATSGFQNKNFCHR
jgi:hypothetical protein